MNMIQRMILLVPVFFLILLSFTWAGYISCKAGYISEDQILYSMLIGLITGLLCSSYMFFKTGVRFLLSNIWICISLSIFHILFIGFFMGVPLFNMAICPLLSLILCNKEHQEKFRVIKICSRFCLMVVCLFSAYIALTDKYSIANLEGMLKINFNTLGLYLLIIFGAVFMFVFQELSFRLINKRISHFVSNIEPQQGEQKEII